MKRFALMIAAACGLFLSSGTAHGFGTLNYGGYQPWWNPFALGHRKCLTPEERRLEQFWHDYYASLSRYYCALDHVDWVTYYKNHGTAINGQGYGGCGPQGCGPQGYGPNGGGCPIIQYAPVFVSPAMQWAVPGSPYPGGPGLGCGLGGPGIGGPGIGGSGCGVPGCFPPQGY